jgi:transcriptional regulator with XRE-family HTH domain
VAKKSESGTPELEAVSEQLRNAAQKLGLSQNQVAKLSGVSRKHVGVAFQGANISVGVLVKLIRALKLDHVMLGDITLQPEQRTPNPHLVEHARTLIEQAEALTHDANELLRAGTSTEHAGRLMRQMASGGRKRPSRKQRAS